MKKLFLLLALIPVFVNAQVGYQISLLDTSTGEPRANETVNVTVKLTNSEGGVIYFNNQTETTNDFGILSLTIGNSNTFKNVDFSKLPFYIEVTANGVMIGKTQVLSVPVAEVAKHLAPIDKNLIIGDWTSINNNNSSIQYSFFLDGIVKRYVSDDNIYVTYEGTYEIDGSNVYCFFPGKKNSVLLRFNNGMLYFFTGSYALKKI